MTKSVENRNCSIACCVTKKKQQKTTSEITATLFVGVCKVLSEHSYGDTAIHSDLIAFLAQF